MVKYSLKIALNQQIWFLLNRWHKLPFCAENLKCLHVCLATHLKKNYAVRKKTFSWYVKLWSKSTRFKQFFPNCVLMTKHPDKKYSEYLLQFFIIEFRTFVNICMRQILVVSGEGIKILNWLYLKGHHIPFYFPKQCTYITKYI